VKKPANAFKYPDSAESAFPQVEIVKPMDFRSEALPTAGFATIGNRRKFASDAVAKMPVVAVETDGSIRGAFAAMDEDMQVQHSDLKIKAIIPKKISAIPKQRIVSAPRRDRLNRKAQRGSAK
jgi:hypothetical protein